VEGNEEISLFINTSTHGVISYQASCIELALQGHFYARFRGFIYTSHFTKAHIWEIFIF